MVRLVGKASLGACNSTESSIISLSFFAAFAAAAALRRFLCAVALACAVQASGSQSWHTRQGLSWVHLTHETGTVLRAEWQTIVQTALLTAAVVIIPVSEMGALRKLWLRFGWRRPVTWSFRHFLSQARLAKDVNTTLKHVTYLTKKHSLRPTGKSSNSHTSTLLSSSSITSGKATGSVSDWTHVRSLARRKSKWTMGGCGALRRCGCAWTYERTQFLCVKFRLGSAG